ncbi:OadG family protein [Clostridium transplantifaecale]|uniref:OadG family protein n=1 Tax=Clostridium transplantifaecale TaxID=2479838 RepID=UPI000F63550F|nr:OadG family protein [Clostridium transplantifaecale]
MKQNMKKVLLVLCMAVSFFALTACSGSNKDSEPVPETIESTMKTGAENYLKEFDSYDDEALATTLKRVQKQKNTVMESAISSWQSSKPDLGRLVSILSEEVERVSEDSYKVTVRASYEERELEFALTAEEVVSDNYGGTSLAATEMVFTPIFTTGEKLERAGMNTLMGMGTVFLVLIFISFIIASLKNVNTLEANYKAKKEAAKAAASEPVVPAPAPSAPVPAPAVPVPAPVPAPVVSEPVPAPEPAFCEEENLADDMELVAVITAAISAAACVPAEGLIVRSIRRKSGSKWKNA